jgi:hypothetical protein
VRFVRDKKSNEAIRGHEQACAGGWYSAWAFAF